MTATVAPVTSAPAPRNRRREALDIARGLVWNPIVEKEILARMRSWRAPLAISIFIFVLSLVGWVAISLISASASNPGGATPGTGLALFGGLMATELVLIILIAPALTAGAISGETERQTLDLLLCTRVRPSSIITGKLVASLLFILLMVLISVPLLSFVFLFGGIEIDQVAVTTLMVMVTAMSIGAIGIFCSTLIRNAIGSTAAAYVLTVIFLVGPALLPLIISAVTTPRTLTGSRGQPLFQLGEPFFALGSTLVPANNGFTPTPVNRLSGSAAGGTVCTSTPNGGTQCRSTGTGTGTGTGFGAPGVKGPVSPDLGLPPLPAGNVVLQGDTVVDGPFQGWHAWQLFTLLNALFAALLLFVSSLLLGSGRVSRASRSLRQPRHAALLPVPQPVAPLPPPGVVPPGE